MSRADQIYRKEQEIDEINRDMRGINPKLSWYKELSDRRAKLEAELQLFVADQDDSGVV
jgi:hypothetical protein